MTSTAATTRRETLTALMGDLGGGAEFIEHHVSQCDDAMVETLIASFHEMAAEKVALRERLMADPALRSVACPANDWKTADDRYNVTRGCIRIIEATAAKNGLTVDALVQALVETEGGIARSIETHREDPRGNSFYAYKWRVRDALEHAGAAAKRAAWEALVAQHEARGEKVCTRCGGAGGNNAWPGFTCYECSGRKFLRTI